MNNHLIVHLIPLHLKKMKRLQNVYDLPYHQQIQYLIYLKCIYGGREFIFMYSREHYKTLHDLIRFYPLRKDLTL